MLVRPSQRLPWEFSKSFLCFLSCLPVWYRPHTLTWIVLLIGWQINIPQIGTFHQQHFNRTFTDSVQEEQLGFFHTGPRVGPFVLRQTYPKIWTFWLWNFQLRRCIFHFDLGKSDTASAAWPEHPGSLDFMSMTFCWLSFGTLMILVQ